MQLTATLKAVGQESEFIAGLRVTDAETRDTALMVLAGRSTSCWWRRSARMASRP